MKRREFITLFGGAAAWPLAARAQQAGRLPTIGVLGGATPSAESQRVAALVQRLQDLGWIEGRVSCEREDDRERTPPRSPPIVRFLPAPNDTL
jgi:hypothetical protein